MVTGPGTIVESMAHGRKAAISIDRYLQGEDLTQDRESEGSQTSPLGTRPSLFREEREGNPSGHGQACRSRPHG